MFFLSDIGGTKMKIGFSKSLEKVDQYQVFKTPINYQDFLGLIKEKISNSSFKKAVFGVAGVFDKKKEKLIYSPNLPNFIGKNLKKDLEKILNCEVFLENDADLAGLGEAVFGRGKNYKIVSYITLSTGVGGSKIVNKKIEENFFGFEPGQSYFLIDKNFFPLKVEELISGSALEKIFKQKPERIKNKKIWNNISYLIAIFLVNVSLFWSPEVIILGGSVSKSLDFNLIRKIYKNLMPFEVKTKILKSKLGRLSGLYGGIVMLKDN